ncbi:MAG TPA: hypothetical protein VI653_09525 [Steroidobacteraceae bacterium]
MSGMVMKLTDHAAETGADAWEVGHYKPTGEWDLLVSGTFEAMTDTLNYLNGGVAQGMPPALLR